jgi:hypothetical protein
MLISNIVLSIAPINPKENNIIISRIRKITIANMVSIIIPPALPSM